MSSFDAMSNSPYKSAHHIPPRTAVVAMWLFLLSLTILFLATMIGYVMFRVRGTLGPPLGTIQFPGLLWLSTALVLLASVTIHRALQSVRREKQHLLRMWLWTTLALAIAFVVVQTPAMIELLQQHTARGERGHTFFGMIFFLILLHAAHVIGGVVSIIIVLARAVHGAYDHESHQGVRFAAMYWHFLDVVWLVMFGGMFLLG
ncbi:MAG TPA: heme-copper oxidase subunit III [Tepidisphaeraceae bacterium]|nr:heme-copper oxidase subunit III [Tepidisphaeraceae bacterium]